MKQRIRYLRDSVVVAERFVEVVDEEVEVEVEDWVVVVVALELLVENLKMNT
jgi:hypothetical protein